MGNAYPSRLSKSAHTPCKIHISDWNDFCKFASVVIEKSNMAKFHQILSIFATVVLATKVFSDERIETITFLTSQCSGCGMDALGSISVKVCGDDACCYTPWMQADFREGMMTHLGGGTIHECFKFKVSEGDFDPSFPTLEFTVFHQGTDGVSFDAIGIETEAGAEYSCEFVYPLFFLGDEWDSTNICSGTNHTIIA